MVTLATTCQEVGLTVHNDENACHASPNNTTGISDLCRTSRGEKDQLQGQVSSICLDRSQERGTWGALGYGSIALFMPPPESLDSVVHKPSL